MMKGLIAASVVAYALIIAGIAFFQRALLYFPDTRHLTPAEAGLPQAQEKAVRTEDGETLVAWWIAPRREDALVYLYFNGNGGNLAGRAQRFRELTREGSGLMVIDYRGYGGSTGSPSETGLHRDAAAAYADLTRSIEPSRIVLFGESLGSGVALKLAANASVRAIVLDSAYYSVLERATEIYWWLPVRLLLIDTFRSDLWISDVKAPVLILHGGRDDLTPPEGAERLSRLARVPTKFRRYSEAGHVSVFRYGAADDIARFLKEAGMPAN